MQNKDLTACIGIFISTLRSQLNIKTCLVEPQGGTDMVWQLINASLQQLVPPLCYAVGEQMPESSMS